MKPVIITTEFRGVFFGYLASEQDRVVELENARNVIYWDAKCEGFAGLAAKGPVGQSRLGAKVEKIKLFGVTSVIPCSPEAEKAFTQ